MIDVKAPEIDPAVDPFFTEDLVHADGGIKACLPGTLAGAENDLPLIVHLNIRMIRRHVGKEIHR